MLKKFGFANYYEEQNGLNAFVRPQGYSQFKHNFVYKKTPQGTFNDGSQKVIIAPLGVIITILRPKTPNVILTQVNKNANILFMLITKHQISLHLFTRYMWNKVRTGTLAAVV